MIDTIHSFLFKRNEKYYLAKAKEVEFDLAPGFEVTFHTGDKRTYVCSEFTDDWIDVEKGITDIGQEISSYLNKLLEGSDPFWETFDVSLGSRTYYIEPRPHYNHRSYFIFSSDKSLFSIYTNDEGILVSDDNSNLVNELMPFVKAHNLKSFQMADAMPSLIK